VSDGWVAVPRRFLHSDSPLHPHQTGEPATRLCAWIDLVGRARWQDSPTWPRGEVRDSRRFLAARWNWSRWKVDRFVAFLVSEQLVRTVPQTGRKSGHITIRNFDTYQKQHATKQPQRADEPRREPGQRRTRVEQGQTKNGALAHEINSPELTALLDEPDPTFDLCPDCGDDKRTDWLKCPKCIRKEMRL